jgi:putative serine/threonine protein kinase
LDESTPLDKLISSRRAKLLCWPGCTEEVLRDRITELRKLGVSGIFFSGRHRIEGIPVLGKGHTGLVLMADTSQGVLALKTRRVDADRFSMEHEARILREANTFGVGPRLVKWSKNFLLMELVEGVYLSDWIKTITPVKAGELKRILRLVLDQARQLDRAGIDHGELVRLRRHVILSNEKPKIVDFESASKNRRVSNVTTVIQSLFLNSLTCSILGRVIEIPDREKLLEALRRYKSEGIDETYQALLRAANL